MNLTQEKMADRLEMATRNFSNLDNKKSSCSAVTLSLFLIYCTDPIEFLDELKKSYEERAYDDFAKESISYRKKLPIKETTIYEKENSVYALCPRCRSVMERDYIRFCGNCGQRLQWQNWEKAPVKEDGI